MAKYPDSTKLVHMSLPGTHDSSTCKFLFFLVLLTYPRSGNYTQATQDALIGYTGPDIPPAEIFQCQEHSYFQMLNGGIRVFDLRFAWNPDNITVGFYHCKKPQHSIPSVDTLR